MIGLAKQNPDSEKKSEPAEEPKPKKKKVKKKVVKIGCSELDDCWMEGSGQNHDTSINMQFDQPLLLDASNILSQNRCGCYWSHS